ncbi:MAG TPA: hypothetical protein VNC22_08260 [Sporichthya sp.]|nr:hypothetical protein [Sporichthya sp.]
MSEARYDLDLADFAEVRRRVIEPVVGALFRAGELRGSDVALGTADRMPGASWTHWGQPSRGEACAQVFALLWAFDGSFAYLLGDADFSRIHATSVAVDWADLVTDWIAESSFGWGELRPLPPDFRAPEPPQPPAGTREVGIFSADEPGGLPLWTDGLVADPVALGLSEALVADLQIWQQFLEAGPGSPDYAEPVPPTDESYLGGACSSTLTFLTSEQSERRELTYRSVPDGGRRAWRAFVDVVEPLRDELLERLREELRPGFHVPTPPRMP